MTLRQTIKTSGRSSSDHIHVTPREAWALIAPYIRVRPRTAQSRGSSCGLFDDLQLLFCNTPLKLPSLFFGLIAVVIGLAVFMEGLSTGLMPFGTLIGDNLPKKASMFVVLIIIGILGVGVTFAEPAIGALQAFGSSVDVNTAPYLYELLNNWTMPLVIMVGAGVGVAAILGTIRFVKGWSLKPMILRPSSLYIIEIRLMNLICAVFLVWLGLWCGTTGPVTVPLVLSLGIGIANAAGRGNLLFRGSASSPWRHYSLFLLFYSWRFTSRWSCASGNNCRPIAISCNKASPLSGRKHLLWKLSLAFGPSYLSSFSLCLFCLWCYALG